MSGRAIDVVTRMQWLMLPVGYRAADAGEEKDGNPAGEARDAEERGGSRTLTATCCVQVPTSDTSWPKKNSR